MPIALGDSRAILVQSRRRSIPAMVSLNEVRAKVLTLRGWAIPLTIGVQDTRGQCAGRALKLEYRESRVR
jgi:hypothetical protein